MPAERSAGIDAGQETTAADDAFAYLSLPGERHGFRMVENVKRTFEPELLSRRLFGMTTHVDKSAGRPFI